MGRSKTKLVEIWYKKYWDQIATKKTTFFRGIEFDEDNEEHTALIETAAMLLWGLEGEVDTTADVPDEINEEISSRNRNTRLRERDMHE